MMLAFAALVPAMSPVQAAETGDAGRGAVVFRQCRSCHEIGEGAGHKVGPHLNGLFGRRAGGLTDFDYSRGLARAGRDGMVWDREKLDIYIANPKSLVSDTNMNFRGIGDADDRRHVIAFLRGYSASPANIVESAPTAFARDPDVDPATLAIEGDPAYGEYLSSECTTCHRVDGADAGIPSITGWPEEDFVTAMHAYKSRYRVHPVMQMMAARLSDEEIASLAVYFETLE